MKQGNNFKEANGEFFEALARDRIEIRSPSRDKPLKVQQGRFEITVVPVDYELRRLVDQRNKKAHANDTVLVLACHRSYTGTRCSARS